VSLSTTIFRSAIAAVCLTAHAAGVQAESIFAILNNDPAIGQQLVTFESSTGAVQSTVVLQTANTLSPLASIDVRPATGQLYGFDATARQLFTINPGSGALTAVGSPLPQGTFGTAIDFNPTVDLIRLIGTGNINLRLNPTTGAIVGTDTNLAYQAGDGNQGETPNIRGIGYTNSFAGASSTTLYDIDVDNDVLVTQTPANSGTLQTVGSLGVNLNGGLFGTFTGFDISGATGTAYLTDGGFAGPSNLYTVNLTTGAATSLGAISGLPVGRTVAEIAVGSPAVVPEPSTLLLLVAGVALMGRRFRA
jgi:hypothetical protein